MVRVSVRGVTGKEYLSDHEMGPGTTVGELRAAAKLAMGITLPGLEVTLTSGALVLADDGLTAEAAQLAEGAVVQAIIQDIISAIRDIEDLPSYDGDNVAMAASLGAWMDVVRLVEAGADLNETYDYGYSALMHLASTPHDSPAKSRLDPGAAAQLMHWLLMKGADPDNLDNNRKTALFAWGKYGGSLEQGEVLLRHGAAVNHGMNGGYTPLWYVRNYRRPAPMSPEDSGVGLSDAEGRSKARGGGAGDGDGCAMWRRAEALLLEHGAEQVPDHF